VTIAIAETTTVDQVKIEAAQLAGVEQPL